MDKKMMLIILIPIVLMIIDSTILRSGTIWWVSLLLLFLIIKCIALLYLIENKSTYPKLIAASISCLSLVFTVLMGLISFGCSAFKICETLELINSFGLLLAGYIVLFTLFDSLAVLLAVSGLSVRRVIGCLLFANMAIFICYSMNFFLSLVYR